MANITVRHLFQLQTKVSYGQNRQRGRISHKSVMGLLVRPFAYMSFWEAKTNTQKILWLIYLILAEA